jgi:hypothetical protein
MRGDDIDAPQVNRAAPRASFLRAEGVAGGASRLREYVRCLRRKYQERINELGAYAFVPVPPLSKGTAFRVVRIPGNDVLNMREYPTDQSRTIDIIPPDAAGVLYLGQTQGKWIFVQYDRSTGWVHRR